MAKTEIVDTSFNWQNKILYFKNLMHICNYILTIFVSLTCIFFFFFFTSLLEDWEKVRKNFYGGGGEEKTFYSIEDRSKKNDNEAKEII